MGDRATSHRVWHQPRLLPRIVGMRPVAWRMYQRAAGVALAPPTEAEKHDAILLLAENYYDDVGDEAFRILDEYGR